jgi:hypothetical protein
MPDLAVWTATGDRLKAHREEAGRIEFIVPANGRITVAW